MMRIVIAPTPASLDRHRGVACEVVRGLGGEPLTSEPDAEPARSSRLLESADLVLLIVGWELDPVPAPERGGDGRRSYAQIEIDNALRHALPLAVLRADDSWPDRERAGADTVLHDFRGELARLAVPFPYETAAPADRAPLPAFRATLEHELRRQREDLGRRHATAPYERCLRLRAWPRPELPAEPYPLLLPIAHPALLGGRERELAELRRLLRQPQPILGLHAASGAGKSSLLLAGLVPGLRAEGQPVALDRHPAEEGLASRLLEQLLTSGEPSLPDPDDHAVETFTERLLTAGRLSGRAPVLVLDQFEQLLSGGAAPDRARVGRLLAATVQRQPGMSGALCRWLLAYRREFHGEALLWLRDVLREARRDGLGETPELPHALDSPERFHAWALPPLGTPRLLSDRVTEATAAFREAIAVPLEAPGGVQTKRYPWRFDDDDLERLARAFGEARAARPEAPLAPQLQVVLAHLVERAGTPASSGPSRVPVPEDPGSQIEEALETHLRQVFETVFPGGSERARRRRAAALLALRELVTDNARRAAARPADLLARALGADGAEILERLAGPRARLVTLEEHPEGWRVAVAHDQLARVIVRFVDGEQAGLGFDRELLAVRRFVLLKTELFTNGERRQATRLPRRHRRQIAAHADALLWDEAGRRWWAACRARQRQLRRGLTVAGVVWLLLAAAGAWVVERRVRRAALYEQVAAGTPGAALDALRALLARTQPEALRQALERREHPLDFLENTLADVPEAERGEVVLDVARIALPLVQDRLSSLDTGEPCPVELQESSTAVVRPLAILLWALEAMPGREPDDAETVRTLREKALAPLWNLCPAPGIDAVGFVDVPAGGFSMGTSETVDGCLDARPRHPVEISAFRMQRSKVTIREFRKLFPGHELQRDGPWSLDDPVEEATWYEAWTYAAWLGGRLPTEAQWEHAAQWEHRERHPPPNPTPANLEDLIGNVGEWTADFSAPYEDDTLPVDPWGPPSYSGGKRIYRGGDSSLPGEGRPTCRKEMDPWEPSPQIGLRIVLPIAPSSSP